MDSGGPPGRLRGELTEFAGRRTEFALARQALVASRPFTLTGLGRIGKTRLALPAVDGTRRAFRDGAWLAEPGGLHDPALLVPEVARPPGPSDQPGHLAMATLSDYLQARHVLLVLDQREHLAGACAGMAAALLRACPKLPIIATSRHVFGVTGEVTVAVPAGDRTGQGTGPYSKPAQRRRTARARHPAEYRDRQAAVPPETRNER
jgi:predicted ATPase